VLTFVLVVAGAMVTSTNSGMAFATWPYSDGRLILIDDPTLAKVLEHSHRLIGWTLGLLAIALVVGVHLRDRRSYMFKASIALLAMICVQGVLGGLRVRLDERYPILYPILHATLAQVVFCSTGLVVLLLSPSWVNRAVEDAGTVRVMRRLAVISLGLVFVQVFLGVVLRHTDSPVALWSHVGFSLVVALFLLIANSFGLGRFAGLSEFVRMCRISLGVLVLQVVLGLIALMIRRPKALADTEAMGQAALVSGHVALGALLLMMTGILVARSYRTLVPRKGT
jgi:cytochrome c oxidase assembly protein subunit 15